MKLKQIGAALVVAFSLLIGMRLFATEDKALPLVAIANFGPHASLDAAIQGIKDALLKKGYVELKNIRYEVMDVGFDASLIPQMINHLKHQHPKVLVTITTPVAQYAKGTIHDIPLVYSVITDPITAGLTAKDTASAANITGSSDKQDLGLLLDFAKELLNQPKRVGILYSTAEANDLALLALLKAAADTRHMEVIAVAINESRDIPFAMQQFKHNVDLIYVGASGAIQPALPLIAALSQTMKVPVFNMNEEAVKAGMALASFGVNYHKVGLNAGQLVADVLEGKPANTLAPIYPARDDHQAFVSQKNAAQLGITLPSHLPNTIVVG